MKSVTPLFLLSMLLMLVIHGFVAAEDEKSDLSRLQGTWKVAKYEMQGQKFPATHHVIWIFNGSKLYKRGIQENVFSIEIQPDGDPKGLDMRPRIRNGRRDLPLKLNAFKFDDEDLVVAEPRVGGKRPDSFVTGVDGSASVVMVLRKISDEDTLSEEVLAQFGDDPLPHSPNRDAEKVLLGLYSSLLRDGSRAAIQNYVDGDAAPLLKLFQLHQKPDNFEEYLTRVGVRDVMPGEQIIYADGTKQVVEAKHLTSTKILLMIVNHGDDWEFFWLTKKNGRWKVDTKNLVEQRLRGGTKLFGGIRIGMDRERIPELLADFKESQNLKFYKVVTDTESRLDVEWESLDKGDAGYICRHRFKFEEGRLLEDIVHGRVRRTDEGTSP